MSRPPIKKRYREVTALTRYLALGIQPVGAYQLPPLPIQARLAAQQGVLVNPFTLETWVEWRAA